MDALHTDDRALWLGDDIAVNPRVAAPTALVTHASRVEAALASESVFVPGPLAYALPASHRATVVPLGREFALGGDVVARFVSSGVAAGVQLVLERGGEKIAVLTGALAADAQANPCKVLILDASYGLPIYRWPDRDQLADSLRSWLQLNRDGGRAAVVAAEPTDEALLIAELSATAVFAHAAVARFIPTSRPLETAARGELAGNPVVVPPSAVEDGTLDRIGPHELALASGRMRVRGTRRRKAIDRGFTLSSRADWPSLMRAVESSGAATVRTLGNHAEALARVLVERGVDARPLEGTTA